jgi:hypothetical protein
MTSLSKITSLRLVPVMDAVNIPVVRLVNQQTHITPHKYHPAHSQFPNLYTVILRTEPFILVDSEPVFNQRFENLILISQ